MNSFFTIYILNFSFVCCNLLNWIFKIISTSWFEFQLFSSQNKAMKHSSACWLSMRGKNYKSNLDLQQNQTTLLYVTLPLNSFMSSSIGNTCFGGDATCALNLQSSSESKYFDSSWKVGGVWEMKIYPILFLLPNYMFSLKATWTPKL